MERNTARVYHRDDINLPLHPGDVPVLRGRIITNRPSTASILFTEKEDDPHDVGRVEKNLDSAGLAARATSGEYIASRE